MESVARPEVQLCCPISLHSGGNLDFPHHTTITTMACVRSSEESEPAIASHFLEFQTRDLISAVRWPSDVRPSPHEGSDQVPYLIRLLTANAMMAGSMIGNRRHVLYEHEKSQLYLLLRWSLINLLEARGWSIQMCSFEIVLLSCGHGTCVEEATIGLRRSSMLENVDQCGSGTSLQSMTAAW